MCQKERFILWIRKRENNESREQKLHRDRLFSNDCSSIDHCNSHIAAWHLQRIGRFYSDACDCPRGSPVLFYDIWLLSDFQIQL